MTPFPDSADPSTEPKNISRPDGIFHPDSTFNTSHSDSSSSISRSGGISRPEGDPLLDILPTAADADRPWLVWYSPDERIELTGHVLSMWAAKTAGLLSAEAGGRPVLLSSNVLRSASAGPFAMAALSGMRLVAG